MVTNHTELCEKLRQASIQCSDCGMYETSSDFDLAVSMIESQAARIAELEKERDALKADAERYRWLRDKANYTHAWAPMVFHCNPHCSIEWTNALFGEKLDASVNAVLQAEKETR